MNTPAHLRRTPWLALVAIAGVIAITLLWMSTNRGSGRVANPTPAPVTPNAEPDSESLVLQKKAHELQKQENWAEAVKAWDELLKHLEKQPDRSGELWGEAQVNRKICQEERDYQPLPHHQIVRMPEPAPEQRPAPIQDLSKRFQAGKKVQGRAVFEIQGQGDNESWLILKTGAYFIHTGEVETETEVLSSDETRKRIRFRQKIPKIEQNLVITKQEIQVDLSRSPLLEKSWEIFDLSLKTAATANPKLRPILIIKQVYASADPNLKHTLSFLFARMGQKGEDLIPDQVEIRTKIDRFSGVEVEIEYESGLGVTEIQTVRGPQLDEPDLKRLADSLSLGLDYYVWPSFEKEPGETWSVNARDVAGMFALGHSAYHVGGTMQMQLESEPTEQTALAGIKVLGGEIDIDSADGDQKGSVRVALKSGAIQFSRERMIVESADFELDSRSEWKPTHDDLLFGVKAVRDLKLHAHYQARIAPAENQNP